MKEYCRICASIIENRSFSVQLLGRSVSYFECPSCSYVQTETPTWLEEAYTSVINDCDTGLIMRNQICAGMVLGTLSSLGKMQGRIVDCAGGYGILTRLLRDHGVDALWSDPYCQNLVAKGFEHDGESADLVTAFEAFEHFIYPVEEMQRLFEIAPNLLISTDIIPTPTPGPDEWWYYGLSHGQHVGFMRIKAMQFLAAKFGKYLLSDGRSYHFFSAKPISMSKWRFHTRLALHLPKIATRSLRSRVWDDYEKMSATK